MKILLKNGQVTDSKNKVYGKRDILIENEKIAGIYEEYSDIADKIIDCTGLAVIPGLFDMHVHFRDPGQTHKEDIFTGADAAAAGGVTGVLCMPNTLPVLDTPELIKYVMNKGKKSKIKLYPVCAITEGFKGEKCCDFKTLKKAGAIAASDDGRPVENARIMGEAIKKAHEAGLLVISHCEDLNVINGGIINEGKISENLGVKGMSRISENIITSREIDLAETLNVPVHIAHVSTKEAVRKIIEAKRNGIKVSCETAPHYFTLTDEKLLTKDADFRMNPPLREKNDKLAVEKAVCEGYIDALVTDHAPHTAEEKADFFKAPNGVIGLETSLSVTLTQLYHTGKLDLPRLVDMMCVKPRKLLGIEGGGLAAGDCADITIINLNEEWVVVPETLHSKSKNTCFKGMTLKGRVKYTFVDGKAVFEQE